MRLPFRLYGRRQAATSPTPIDWLIVGLGNPGRRYAGNRHNVGFHVVDLLAAADGLSFDQQRNRAHLAHGQIEGARVILAKPQTYMNLSGEAVGALARFYKMKPERILVIFDDLDLPLGTLRLRLRGGAGGHKGVSSIITHLNSRDFPRLRIGIGRPPGRMPPEVYVLQDFTRDEKQTMQQTYQTAIDAIHMAMRDNFEMAMNRFN
ncbi:MAG: aminoacyl-tRNA hydrolase [Anaerolineae bacterium]